MPVYQDIDLYGRENPDGSPVTYTSVDAIKHALFQWVNSSRGDYVMNPTAGGALDSFVFKSLNASNFNMLRFELLTALTTRFAPSITVNSIDLIPDYDNRMMEVQISYSIPAEGVSDTLSIFTNSNYSYNTFEYEDVAYTGENLYQFFVIKKADLASSRLIYDYDLDAWKWSKYKLINLLPTDPYFTQILALANGS